MKRDVAHLLRVVADELDALRVVAHRVEHAAQRRAREGEHQRRADEGVDRDQVIHLDLRAEGDAEERPAGDAVARDAALAAEELREHQRHGEHQLADAQRDHREGRAGLLAWSRSRTARAKNMPARPPTSGTRLTGSGSRPCRRRFSAWMARNAPRPRIHRVAEAEHAALPQQHVVRQADDDGDAHLRQHRAREVAGEEQRRDDEHQGERTAPQTPAQRRCRVGESVTLSLPACRAGPWAGRSASAPAAGRAGSARPATIVRLQQRIAEAAA